MSRVPPFNHHPVISKDFGSKIAAPVLAGFFALAMPFAAHADPSRGGSNLGGGFIEFLMTGSTPSHRQGAPAPYYRPDMLPTGQIIAPRQQRIDYGQQARPVAYRLEEDPVSQPVYRGRGERQERAPAPVDARISDPRFDKQDVAYTGPHGAGTIVIDTPNRFLYLVQGNGRALRYGIGVGRPGFEWAGVKSVSQKREWPDWRPPAEMLKRRPDLPRHMAGGVENPLGARALYLGSSLYRIHGTNEPNTIGQAVSSGCIRMRNEDVTDLYERVRVGAKVIVI